MDPVSPLPALSVLLVAFATSFLLVRKFGSPPVQGRFTTIDGLRGYLAVSVFLHHSCIWYFYLRTGKWQLPPSNLYTHLGQSGVALFFMITGLLFFSKLIDGRSKSIDWRKLFISRFLRLVPLYLFSMLLLFLIVAYISHGILNESIPKLMREAIRWIGLRKPDINGLENTYIIISGVNWSLPYEWFFYFSLPLLALFVGVRAPMPYMALGIASVVGMAMWPLQIHNIVSFFGGIAASFLMRSKTFRRFSVSNTASIVVLFCAGITITAFPSADGFVPFLLLSVAFALIASGNSMFGVLVSPASRFLGEFAYSIYLLHGIALFIVFNFILGFPESQAITPISHWLIVIGITPFLILACFFTFRFIERPAMQSAANVSAWRWGREKVYSKELLPISTPGPKR